MNKKIKRDKQANLEKDMLINPKKHEEKKKKKIIRQSAIAGLVLLTFLITILISFGIIRAIGKLNLTSKAAASAPELSRNTMSEKPTKKEQDRWQEGWIKYQNQVYAYNDEILTFLFMGIDKRNEVIEMEEGTDGGQADALFLLVLNPSEKTIQVIGINRNTMTDIDIYNEMGAYMTTATAQIAVQHGFGNGMEESCEYQLKAVKNLFYNLPIHGYCAINMDAVTAFTDLMGGLELTALEDVRLIEKNGKKTSVCIKEGETKQLNGKEAYSYVRYRDMEEMGSADMRLKRQQQFLEQFIKKVKEASKKDITIPIKLYKEIQSHMVTNVSIDEVAYLASTAVNYSFEQNQFYSIKGENVMGEQFEEYYIDETALYEMILDIFYESVEE